MIKASWAAHAGASSSTAALAQHLLSKWIDSSSFIMTDDQPDIILFMTGGSERHAISMLDSEKPVLLLAVEGHNAYAAATEVMAWLVNRNRVAVISSADDAYISGLITRWQKAAEIWDSLKGKKAGLIGTVADWLVASDVPAERLRSALGVTLEQIAWTALPDYSTQEADAALLNRFAGSGAAGLSEAARVVTLLRKAIASHGLNAVAVECFSLVQQKKVTACLALAQLNDEGTVAACEGDTASLAGMMLLQAVTSAVSWMANTTRISGNTLLLSHCTAAFGLVENVTLPTHFETDCSLAVKGTINASEVTLFRFSENLNRAFITEGKVSGHPEYKNACRTQVEIELPPQAAALLQHKPLGNHLLMAPGRHAELLRLVCAYRGIEVIG